MIYNLRSNVKKKTQIRKTKKLSFIFEKTVFQKTL